MLPRHVSSVQLLRTETGNCVQSQLCHLLVNLLTLEDNQTEARSSAKKLPAPQQGREGTIALGFPSPDVPWAGARERIGYAPGDWSHLRLEERKVELADQAPSHGFGLE